MKLFIEMSFVFKNYIFELLHFVHFSDFKMIKIIVIFLFMFSSSFCKQTRSVEIPDVTIKEDIKIGLF